MNLSYQPHCGRTGGNAVFVRGPPSVPAFVSFCALPTFVLKSEKGVLISEKSKMGGICRSLFRKTMVSTKEWLSVQHRGLKDTFSKRHWRSQKDPVSPDVCLQFREEGRSARTAAMRGEDGF